MFNKKEWVRVYEANHDSGLFIMGFLSKKDYEKRYCHSKRARKTVTFVADTNSEPTAKLIKKMKKCKHENLDSLFFEHFFERTQTTHYCVNCGKVIEEVRTNTNNTQTLINIKFAEGRAYEAKEEIERLKREIIRQEEELKKAENEVIELKSKLTNERINTIEN